jgi:hypothetical protein
VISLVFATGLLASFLESLQLCKVKRRIKNVIINFFILE